MRGAKTDATSRRPKTDMPATERAAGYSAGYEDTYDHLEQNITDLRERLRENYRHDPDAGTTFHATRELRREVQEELLDGSRADPVSQRIAEQVNDQITASIYGDNRRDDLGVIMDIAKELIAISESRTRSPHGETITDHNGAKHRIKAEATDEFILDDTARLTAADTLAHLTGENRTPQELRQMAPHAPWS